MKMSRLLKFVLAAAFALAVCVPAVGDVIATVGPVVSGGACSVLKLDAGLTARLLAVSVAWTS